VDGISNIANQSTQLITILFFSVILGILATLFLFKNRKIQIKISGWVLILHILLLITIFVSWFIYMQDPIEQTRIARMTTNHPDLGTFLIMVSLLTLFLGRRNVQKDEALVRSIDRIR